MDARRARDYLNVLYKEFKKDSEMEKQTDSVTDTKNPYAEAVKVALDAVEPPLGSGFCEWIYLPDKDLMPYNHIAQVTQMQDWLENMKDEFKDKPNKIGLLRVSVENVRVLSMALTVYKAVLMQVNMDEIRKRLSESEDEN